MPPVNLRDPHREDLNHLFLVTYEELRRLASSIRRGDPFATLSPTTLVHEAWLKLAASQRIGATSELHFKRIAGRAMRQVLVEIARRRSASKRAGGSGVALVTFDESLGLAESVERDVLALEGALEELARMNPRQAALVEGRFFAGLNTTEIAELLEVSEATVDRDWRAAKAWLARELRQVQ
jgi:RNA polymerase sigma factor (TIGR02999 family)